MLNELEKKSATLHVLLNCPEVEPFLELFKSQFHPNQVYAQFVIWFTQWVFYSPNVATYDQFLKDISLGPVEVHTMSLFTVNRFKFTIEEHSTKRKTNCSEFGLKVMMIILASYKKF